MTCSLEHADKPSDSVHSIKIKINVSLYLTEHNATKGRSARGGRTPRTSVPHQIHASAVFYSNEYENGWAP
jgi:N-formylglutamate amidohydrolase